MRAARNLHRITSDGRPLAEVVVELSHQSAGWRLSFTGKAGHTKGADWHHYGQCQDAIRDLAGHHPEVAKLLTLWERWHLNDMRAGCEHQRAEGWDARPIDPGKLLTAHGTHYPGQEHPSWNNLAWVPQDEHPDGLLLRPCPTCGYRYGEKWLLEPVPREVLEELGKIPLEIEVTP